MAGFAYRYVPAVPSTRATPTALVVCADCGTSFELSKRNVLEHERRGMPDRCGRCRHPDAGPSPAQVERMKSWWVTTYGLDNVRSWPPL